MLKVIGKGSMHQFSREIVLDNQIHVNDLPGLLQMPEELSDNLVVVRGHLKLDSNDLLFTEDEIFIFLAVMGG